MVNQETSSKWALILGGSSGLGLATARKLAQHQFNLLIIHRDRRTDLEEINNHFQEITLNSIKLHSFNVDVVNAQKRDEVLKEMELILGGEKIDVMVHSIAKGNLRPMNDLETGLKKQDFELTFEAMALSLYDWTKCLVDLGLFADDARIISFTSEGSSKSWIGYGAVSAAKAALEAITRSMALEFAPLGIKANCIQAGTTDTKSLRAIPNSDILKERAVERNPNKRLTTPEDVANVVYLLTLKEANWITGTVITVDGGESLR